MKNQTLKMTIGLVITLLAIIISGCGGNSGSSGSSGTPVNRAPTLTAIGNQSVNENILLTFVITGTDPDSDTLTFSATGLPSGATFVTSTRTFSWTPSFIQSGVYTGTIFTVTDDGVGALSDSEVITITVNNVDTAPVLTAIGNKGVNENANLAFTLVGADTEGDTMAYTMVSTPTATGATLDAGTGAFSWTPSYTQAGSYSVEFVVTSTTLSDSEVITVVVTNVNRAPILTAIGNKSVNEMVEVSFVISGTDADADTLTFSATGLPTGANFYPVTRTFSWIPSYSQSGTHTEIIFRVTDPYTIYNEEAITITVNNINRAPTLDAINNQSVDENILLTFVITGTDPDSDALAYSATGLPSGATFVTSTRTFSWTPSFIQSGVYTGTVFSVTDNGAGTLSDSEAITITVNNVDTAPVLTAIGNKGVNENANLAFTLVGADTEGDTMAYTMVSTPTATGATLDAGTGAFSWTPSYTQAGSYSVEFVVTSTTLSDSEVITIVVTNVNRAPILDAIGNQSVNEDILLTFVITGTDPDSDTLAYSATGLPTGATFITSTRTFSWTPSFIQSGVYTGTIFTITDNGVGALTDSEAITITVNNINRAPILDAINNQSVDENILLTFVITGTDPDSDALAYSATGLPSGATFVTSTRTFSWTPSFIQSGVYTDTIFTVTDNGTGTLSDSESITITVNDVDTAPVLTAVGAKSVNENANLAFTLVGSDTEGDIMAYTMVSTPTATGATLDTGTGAFDWTPGYTQSGSYSVEFVVTSTTFSDSEVITVVVTNVNQAPILTAIGNQTTDENILLTFVITGTDPDSDTLEYSAAGLPSGATFVTSTRTFSWTPDYGQSGVYPNIIFRATDTGALYDEKAITITINNVNRAPTLNAIGNQSTDENILLTFVITGTDPDADTLEYSATGLPSGATFITSTGTFSWTPSFTQSGVYTGTIFTITDNGVGALTDSEAITITVNNVDTAPVLTAVGAKSVNENTNLAFTLIGSDTEGDTMAYTMVSTPTATGATLDAGTGAFSWTPGYTQSGSYSVEFVVTSTTLSDSEVITVVVTNINRAPILTAIGNQSVNENILLTFVITGTDPDSDTLTFSATGLPLGATFITNTGTFSWTPDYGQSGVYPDITFRTTDTGALYDEEAITITVNNVNRAPILTAIGNQTTDEGKPLTFVITGTDPDSDTLEYSATGLPTGATFVTSTRTFSWTPDYTQSNTYSDIIFTVTDTGAGALTDSETIAITVNDTVELSNRGTDYWQYYRPITITNSASAITDYLITVIPFNDPAVSNTWLYNTGLVGSWHFSEITGTAVTTTDMSGNGNKGTLTNGAAITTTGRFGNACSFDGTDDYVSMVNEQNFDFDVSNPFMIEAWIKTSDTDSNNAIGGKFTIGPTTGYYFAAYNAVPGETRLLIQLQSDESSYKYRYGNTNLSDGVWHHVAGSYDGSNTIGGLRLFVDGIEQSYTNGELGSLTTILNNAPVNIGRREATQGAYFNGLIDEVRIYNRALSADEIAARYNNNAPKVKGDYADIRFTNAGATQEYNYWQETDNLFRVKLPTLPTGDTAIRMYYGNISATDSSNLANIYGAGIVGFWPFSEGAGAVTYDRSGNNNNGTLYNSPAWTSGGRFGNAISFSTAGANYVQSQNNVGITGAQSRSLSFWVKTTSITARNSFVKYGASSPLLTFGTGSDFGGSNKLYFAGYGDDLLGTTVLSNNIWYYVVITYNGSLVSMYLNGAFQISGAKALNTADSPISFAKQLAFDWLFLDGLIDETRLYNRVLTVDEIASGYVAPANDPTVGAPGQEQ